MDIYQAIELIKTKLEEGNTNSGDLLYKVNILTDPYSDLIRSVPLVLMEADKTEFLNSAQGFVVSQEHFITLSCIVSAQNSDFNLYKMAVNTLAKDTINKMMSIKDYKIQRIIPAELAHSEIMIGSLKTTAVIISAKIQTYWEDD
jgi:hypothetical protein